MKVCVYKMNSYLRAANSFVPWQFALICVHKTKIWILYSLYITHKLLASLSIIRGILIWKLQKMFSFRHTQTLMKTHDQEKKKDWNISVNVVNFLSPSFSAQEIIHKTSINSNHLFDLHQEIWKFLITWQIFCGLHLFTCPNMSCMAANRLLQDWMWKGSYILVWLFLREIGK